MGEWMILPKADAAIATRILQAAKIRNAAESRFMERGKWDLIVHCDACDMCDLTSIGEYPISPWPCEVPLPNVEMTLYQ